LVEEPIGTVPADGGYWNTPADTATSERHIDVLIPSKGPKAQHATHARATSGDEAERIKRSSTPPGQALYRRRQQIVEPVFASASTSAGSTASNGGSPRLSSRMEANRATHNLLKLWRAGNAACC
jgi:hypothetical protein